MVNELLNIWISFVAGLSAPLVAVCVLPLYPGFLAFLSSQIGSKNKKVNMIKLSLVTAFGVILSLFILGLLFSALLKTSLTKAIGIISPLAFVVLGIVSLLMIFNFDIGKFFPKIQSPVKKNPWVSALFFGLFFGAIVLPCNPAPLVVLFSLSTSATSFIFNLINFILFGIGMAVPLILLGVVSETNSKKILGFLTRNSKQINFWAGLIMLGISIYYLVFVFDVLGLKGILGFG